MILMSVDPRHPMEHEHLPDFSYALLSERKGYPDSLTEKERTQNAGYLDIQQIHRSITGMLSAV